MKYNTWDIRKLKDLIGTDIGTGDFLPLVMDAISDGVFVECDFEHAPLSSGGGSWPWFFESPTYVYEWEVHSSWGYIKISRVDGKGGRYKIHAKSGAWQNDMTIDYVDYARR
jgi:hypothetical protein